MYGIDERVVYGVHGVCRVSGFEERTVDRKKCVYMVLEPSSNRTARFYVPTHNEIAMSKVLPLLTKEMMEELLASPAIRTVQWIPDENRRKQTYRELINSGNRERLLGTVFTLYRHREVQAAAGKKFHVCDDNFLHDAERILSEEIENVLGINTQEAREYLRSRLTQ